jgi:hypothetical protein
MPAIGLVDRRDENVAPCEKCTSTLGAQAPLVRHVNAERFVKHEREAVFPRTWESVQKRPRRRLYGILRMAGKKGLEGLSFANRAFH